jgi:hypothetical protein
MKELAQLLNEMQAAGVIENYALFGAMAQMRYTEAVATLDADVLIAVASPERMDVLAGVYDFCARRGFAPEGDAIRVGAWPVQFVPAFSPLTEEALKHADTADFEGVPFRVVRADHLATIALSVGRAKDYARILALLESSAATREEIAGLAAKHGLSEAWRRFEARFGDE